jgi:hypothetical protein
MMMLGKDKQSFRDSIVEGIVGGEKKYSTEPKEMGEAAKLCALEFLKAIEMKDPSKLIAAFEALKYELESESEDEEEGTEIEIKL